MNAKLLIKHIQEAINEIDNGDTETAKESLEEIVSELKIIVQREKKND